MCQSEFQNAHQAAVHEHDFNPHSERIQDLLADGKFVVVADKITYCPYTDAVMGYTRYYISAHFTRETAERASMEQEFENSYHGDPFFSVLPREESVSSNDELRNTIPSRQEKDDIPF